MTSGQRVALAAGVLTLGLVAACDTVAYLQAPVITPFPPIVYPKTAYERMVDARIAAAENCVKSGGVPLFGTDAEVKECHFPPAPTITNHYMGVPVGAGTSFGWGTAQWGTR